MKTKICTKCKLSLSIKKFGIHKREKDGLQNMCKPCESVYRKEQYVINKEKILKRNRVRLQKSPWIATLYNIRERCNCKTHKKYHRYGGRGIKCLITADELKELWFRDKAYLLAKPSIDRQDNDGNYEYSNCKYMEIGENSLKMNLRLNTKAVYQIDTYDNIIKEFISISEATRQTGINNISKVIRNLCKTAGGFQWKLKEVQHV